MLTNLFQTNFKGFSFFLFVCFFLFVILWGCYTKHRFQWLNYLILFYLFRITHQGTIFYSSCSFYNHVVASFYFKFQRVKEINLSRCTKSYSNYFNHISSLFAYGTFYFFIL